MTSWAMLAVELLNPYMPELSSFWEDCPFCRRSLQSVMSANLLLFKTVVAGDSWGQAGSVLRDPADGFGIGLRVGFLSRFFFLPSFERGGCAIDRSPSHGRHPNLHRLPALHCLRRARTSGTERTLSPPPVAKPSVAMQAELGGCSGGGHFRRAAYKGRCAHAAHARLISKSSQYVLGIKKSFGREKSFTSE